MGRAGGMAGLLTGGMARAMVRTFDWRYGQGWRYGQDF